MADMKKKGRRGYSTIQPKTRNEKHWKVKFSVDQVRTIRSRADEPRKKLAAEFSTSARYISSIISGSKRKYA